MRFVARLPRFVPARRLALAAAAIAPLWLFTGTAAGWWIPALATLILVAVTAGDALATPGRGRIDVEREAPPSVGVGDAAEITYRVRSRWFGPVAIRLYHRLPAGLAEDVAPAHPEGSTMLISPVSVVIAPPGATTETIVRIHGAVRGRHMLGRIAARITGPLGLVERSLSFDPGDAVLVTPSLAGVRRYRLLALQHRLRDAGIRTVRIRGEGTSFAGLRAYAVGDDPRHIDWKATAKRRSLITREYAVEQGQTIMILIDCGRMMTQLADDLPRFEHVLAAALTLADVAASGGDRVGVMLFDDEVRSFVAPIRGPAALAPIRQALVPAAARLVEPDYAAAFRTLAARHRKRSLLVLFTDVIDRRASASLIAHTSRAVVRHLPVVVALRNDELLQAAVPAAADEARDAFESAAAEELVMARDEALHGMRQIGIDVLDVSPRAMTAAVINRYLAIKARASL